MAEYIQKLEYEIIQKASEKYANINEAFITLEVDGKQIPFMVEVYKVFSPVSITSLVQELLEKLERVKSHDKDKLGDIIMPYLMFLTIKHFTTLKLPNEFNQQILAIENMLNTGALLQIFMQFDESQITLIKEELDFALKNFEQNFDLLKQYQETIKHKIQDKSLLVE